MDSEPAASSEAISIGDHGLSRLLAGKLSPCDLRLLQQNRPVADIQLLRCRRQPKGILRVRPLSARADQSSFPINDKKCYHLHKTIIRKYRTKIRFWNALGVNAVGRK